MIRTARSDEAAAIARLGEETFLETFVHDGFRVPYPQADLAPFLADAYSTELFAARIADPAYGVWVAEDMTGLIGYAVAGPCGLPHPDVMPDDHELKQIYLRKSAQGSGLGRALFDTSVAWMEAQSTAALWLGVWSGNLKAQRFYAANGFTRVGEYLFPVGSWRDQEFIFRRNPKPS